MRRLKRFNWKNIISVVLVGVLLVGAVAGLGSIFAKDTKTISSMAFSVGAINAEGNYEESKRSIYTKDLIECDGLAIEPDFEATGTYQVFYYDSNKNFMESTGTMNASEGAYSKGETAFGACYCRIMITPDVPVDDAGVAVEDFKIRFYDVAGYVNEYKITVNKVQDLYCLTDFEHNSRTTGKTYGVGDDGKIREDSAADTVTVYSSFDVADYSVLAFRMEVTGGAGNGHIIFVSEDETVIESVDFTLGAANYIEDGVTLLDDVSVPNNAARCYIVGCTAMSYMSVYGK